MQNHQGLVECKGSFTIKLRIQYEDTWSIFFLFLRFMFAILNCGVG